MPFLFKVGQLVKPKRRWADYSNGVYKITRLMPPGLDDVPLYRIQSPSDGTERVVRQDEVVRVSPQ